MTACSKPEQAEPPKVLGAPGTTEYVAAQAGDLPAGLKRCDYSGTIPAHIEARKSMKAEASSISGTWTELQAAGGKDSFITIYAETPNACTTWITGGPDGHLRGGSRVVTTVVVRFDEPATAEAAYRADIFKQSLLTSENGLRALSGPATKLGQNSATGADETANPTTHQAVWQNGAFNVFFASRNLTRAEFETAIVAENRRIA